MLPHALQKRVKDRLVSMKKKKSGPEDIYTYRTTPSIRMDRPGETV